MVVTSPFLTAEWRDLVMLSYEVDPELLAGLVPAGTELDRWQGRALVSIVGFRFLRTRLLGIPIPFHRDFEELNLRFYVRRADPESPDGHRRGVVFVREIVPRRAIAWVARTVYHENYVALPMRHAIADEGDARDRRVRYEWRQRGRWSRLEVVATGALELPPPTAEATFVTEHYWGYARQPDGGTLEYRVEHPRWRVRAGRDATLDGDLEALYGPRFAAVLAGAPTSAFVAEGSPVVVRRALRCA